VHIKKLTRPEEEHSASAARSYVPDSRRATLRPMRAVEAMPEAIAAQNVVGVIRRARPRKPTKLRLPAARVRNTG
jgi:hypothetical protein